MGTSIGTVPAVEGYRLATQAQDRRWRVVAGGSLSDGDGGAVRKGP